MKLGAEERVAELTARWQAPSTINFYNRLRLHYGHRCVITTGNTVSQDRPSRGVSLNKTKINFVSMIFLLFRPSFSLVLVRAPPLTGGLLQEGKMEVSSVTFPTSACTTTNL